jgi:hypothetical protein
MKMKRLEIKMGSLLMVLTLFASCSKDTLTGEGAIVTKTRELREFSKVELSGIRSAEIISSDKSMVEITGYENLIPVFESNVNNGGLAFKYPNLTRVKNDNITLKIYTKTLSNLIMSGETKVIIGSGFVGNTLEANLSGSSDLRIGDGRFERFEISSSGESKVYARDLATKSARVNISGRSFIEVKAMLDLSIVISGAGEVHYWGNPTVSSQISGSGKAVKH